MKTRSKLWLGVGAFALMQAAGVSYESGRPVLTVAQPAEAAGTCGWSRNDNGRWYYDSNCESGERYNSRPGYNQGRNERWNERGERWNDHDRRWERGERWNNGNDRWGERG